MAFLFGCLMPHDFQALGCQSSLGRNQLVPIDTWTSYSTPFSSLFGIFGHPKHVTCLVSMIILYGLDLWETHWRSSSVSHLRTLLLIIFYLVLGAVVGSGLYVSWPFFEGYPGASRRPDIASWIYLGFVEGWGYGFNVSCNLGGQPRDVPSGCCPLGFPCLRMNPCALEA